MKMEKMALSLVIASIKLHPYFQAYTIVVMTDQAIKKVMNKLDAAGHIIQLVFNSCNAWDHFMK